MLTKMFFLVFVLFCCLFVPLFLEGSVLRQVFQRAACYYLIHREHALWKPRYHTHLTLSDRILGVPEEWIRVNHGCTKDRIRVASAQLQCGSNIEDVTEAVRALWKCSHSDTENIQISLPSLASTTACGSEPDALVIVYTGHSNPARKLSAQTFTRIYWSRDGLARFPPYDATSQITRGLGVKHVISAQIRPLDANHDVDADDAQYVDAVDVSVVVKALSGLKGNFYQDLRADRIKDLKFALAGHLTPQEQHQLKVAYNSREGIIL
jgi:hypothetical protein